MPQDDIDFDNIPFFKQLKELKLLLQTLKEMHSGEMFAMLKPQDIADNFNRKSGKNYSAIKVTSLIRQNFGDHVIEKHKSRYFAIIYIHVLNRLLKKYKVE